MVVGYEWVIGNSEAGDVGCGLWRALALATSWEEEAEDYLDCLIIYLIFPDG